MNRARLTDEPIIGILQEHQASSKRTDRPSPVMGDRTGFHRHNATRLKRYELQPLLGRQFAAGNHCPSAAASFARDTFLATSRPMMLTSPKDTPLRRSATRSAAMEE